MSAKMSVADLQSACQRILVRVREHRVTPLPCPVCSICVSGGEEKLCEHISSLHGITMMSLSDVVDYDGFMNHLVGRMGTGEASKSTLCCPVCLEAVGDAGNADSLKAHVQSAAHQVWDAKTIAGLQTFCLPDAEGEDNPAEAAANDKYVGRNDIDVDGNEEELLGSDDDWNEDCQCLYCDNISEACLEHMKEVHNFDFRVAARSRADVTDEYDVIRLINAVRRAVAAGKCPYTFWGGSTEAQTTTACDLAGQQSLEEHLLSCSEHRLPKEVQRGNDGDLVPALTGDALISLVVTAGEGFLREEEEADPGYPMAPTLQEVVAHQAAKNK